MSPDWAIHADRTKANFPFGLFSPFTPLQHEAGILVPVSIVFPLWPIFKKNFMQSLEQGVPVILFRGEGAGGVCLRKGGLPRNGLPTGGLPNQPPLPPTRQVGGTHFTRMLPCLGEIAWIKGWLWENLDPPLPLRVGTPPGNTGSATDCCESRWKYRWQFSSRDTLFYLFYCCDDQSTGWRMFKISQINVCKS